MMLIAGILMLHALENLFGECMIAGGGDFGMLASADDDIVAPPLPAAAPHDKCRANVRVVGLLMITDDACRAATPVMMASRLSVQAIFLIKFGRDGQPSCQFSPHINDCFRAFIANSAILILHRAIMPHLASGAK